MLDLGQDEVKIDNAWISLFVPRYFTYYLTQDNANFTCWKEPLERNAKKVV